MAEPDNQTIATRKLTLRDVFFMFLVGTVGGAAYMHFKHTSSPDPVFRLISYLSFGFGILVIAFVIYLVARAGKSRNPVAIAWGVILFFLAFGLLKAV